MNEKVKLQVPISRDAYNGLEKRAKELGFDSTQAYIRFWAKAETDGRSILDNRQDLSKASAQALRYIELLIALHKDEFEDAQSAVEYVRNKLRTEHLAKSLKQMLEVD